MWLVVLGEQVHVFLCLLTVITPISLPHFLHILAHLLEGAPDLAIRPHRSKSVLLGILSIELGFVVLSHGATPDILPNNVHILNLLHTLPQNGLVLFRQSLITFITRLVEVRVRFVEGFPLELHHPGERFLPTTQQIEIPPYKVILLHLRSLIGDFRGIPALLALCQIKLRCQIGFV